MSASNFLNAPPAPGLVRLRTLRPFWINASESTTIGQLVDVDAVVAGDILQSRRAEIVDVGQWADIKKANDADTAGQWRAGKPSRYSGRS